MSKVLNILVFCIAGASTSYFVESMKEAANKQNIEVNIRSDVVMPFPKDASRFDVILLAPQVKSWTKTIKKLTSERDIPIIPIPFSVYGLHEFDKVFNIIDNALHQKS